MIKVLLFVNWPVYTVKRFEDTLRNPDQVIFGERYWFSKYWPNNVKVNVLGIQQGILFDIIERVTRIHLQPLETLAQIKNHDLILTYDSTSAFQLALLRSKFGFCKSIPNIMIDVGMPRAVEQIYENVPPKLLCALLKQTFNPKSVSHIIFHSSCQRSFYRDILGFSENMLSYVPFGVETEYFKPKLDETEDYIFASGEFRDFETLLRLYEKKHYCLPELRIRSALSPPKLLPPKVKWLPRAPISTFKNEALRSRFVIVPLHLTIRSTGVMSCLQSMALGKTVLTSRVPPIEGYVINGKTALYYEPYNQTDLFNKITFLLEQDKLVREIGMNARLSVEKDFTVKNFGTRLWNCIANVLENN